MSKKQVIKRREPKKLLGIHVIGAGKGESILLELPNREWGVVDCFSPSLTKKHLNQTLRLLADFDVTRLCFICLTHPHEAVEKIFHHTQALFSTALDATTVATRTMEDMLSEYRLQQVLKQSSAAARIRRLPFATGVYRCSFYFGPNGDYVKHELDGSAGEILLQEKSY